MSDELKILISAVDVVLEDALARVEVHPCDYENENIKRNSLSEEMKLLYDARQKLKTKEKYLQ